MIAERALRNAPAADRLAGKLVLSGEAAHDIEPARIGKRVQRRRERNVVEPGMMMSSHIRYLVSPTKISQFGIIELF